MPDVQKQGEIDLAHEESNSSLVLKRWRGRGKRSGSRQETRRGLRRYGPTPDRILALAALLCERHPEISTDPSIYGGNPHIKNVRLTVANILAKLYRYGNVKAVADIYAPHVSEYQVKEAIAYAQDFLEAAVHPHTPVHPYKTSETDG